MQHPFIKSIANETYQFNFKKDKITEIVEYRTNGRIKDFDFSQKRTYLPD